MNPRVRTAGLRRGGVYVAVLGTSLLVTVVGLSAIAVARVQRAQAAGAAEFQQARLNALSACESAVGFANASAGWRTAYAAALAVNAAGAVPMPVGSASYALSDPLDGDLTNRPTDPVLVRAVGSAGRARQLVEVRLAMDPVPLDVLRYAVATPGELRTDSQVFLQPIGAPAYSGAAAVMDGTLEGTLWAAAASGTGIVTGGTKPPDTSAAFPGAGPVALYTSLGTSLGAGSGVIERFVLTPGRSTLSASTNSDGVYVLNASGNIELRNFRVEGTLVIRAPGRTVTLSGALFMRPARPDYPALIVDGNLVLNYNSPILSSTSSSVVLSETATLTNFNPSGAPYNGSTDLDVLDTYPSEIRGLVHVRGSLNVTEACLVRGAVIAEGTGSGAFRVRDHFRVEWDDALLRTPPMGYASRVDVVPQLGTWRQVVDP